MNRHTNRKHRDNTFEQVNQVPHNNYKGFDERLQAERAYLITYTMGGVCRLPPRGTPDGHVSPAVPIPVRLMERFAALPNKYLGEGWYTVFKGKTPSVYPSW